MGELSKEAGFIEAKTGEAIDHNPDNNSNRLLDGDAKKFFEALNGYVRELYRRWRNCKVRVGSWQDDSVRPWDDADSQKLKELRDMSWGDFKTIEQVVEMMSTTAEHMGLGANGGVGELQNAWTGKDAEAATQMLGEFATASGTAKTEFKRLYDELRLMGGETHRTIKELSTWAGGGDPAGFVSKYGGYKPNSGEGTDEDGMRKMVDWIDGDPDVSNGMSNAEIAEEIDTANIDEDTVLGYINQLDVVARDYSRNVSAARQRINAAHSAVQGLLQTYTSTVNGMELDPFTKLRQPKLKGGGKDTGKGPGPGSGGPGPGSGGPGPGAGGPGPGAGGPGPSAGTDPADAGGKPAEGTNPVTGKPLEIDPATGKPYPIDPTTGEPIKDAGDDQDTTTTKQGDKEISMTEPSKTGEMEVGVDDGKGGQKNYRLDFDPANNPKDGKDGESVGGGAAGYGPQGAGGKDGAASGKGTGPEDAVHTPGEDGKIRIKDGDVEIVAEQPLGPDGATVVTVDDGSGKPMTQVLGDKEDVDEYKRLLNEDEQRLVGHREELEGRENTSKAEWDELKKAEDSFRERGGDLPDEDGKQAEKVSDSQPSGSEERSTPKSVFDDAEEESKSSGGIGSSAFDEAKAAGGGGGGGASGLSGAGGGGGGAAGGIGGSVSDLEGGARSGVGAPPGGGAGVAAAPGAEPAAASSGSGKGMAGAGAMGGGMMGGMGAGGGGGGDEQQRSTNAAYQVHGGLFEPEVAEGPFGVARISGSLDDEEV